MREIRLIPMIDEDPRGHSFEKGKVIRNEEIARVPAAP